MVVLGSEAFAFEVQDDWAKLPTDFAFLEVAAVAVDRSDRVYVFNRGKHPMMVFERDGTLVSSWGEGRFTGPHGAVFGPDGALYLVDDLDHTVRRCTVEGTETRRLAPGAARPFSGVPFSRPTHIAIDPDSGEFFVSDGYGNARVHRYSASWNYLSSFGAPGTDPGQFHLPHNIVIDRSGRLYVADRENHRVQVFDRSGAFVTQWVNLHRACALWIERDGREEYVYVGELGSAMAFSKAAPNLGPRISVFKRDGTLITRLGSGPAGERPGEFITPHGLAMDSHGDLYVGECSWSTTGRYLDPPRELRSLQKLVRR